jgi:hypothetical protein
MMGFADCREFVCVPRVEMAPKLVVRVARLLQYRPVYEGSELRNHHGNTPTRTVVFNGVQSASNQSFRLCWPWMILQVISGQSVPFTDTQLNPHNPTQHYDSN